MRRLLRRSTLPLLLALLLAALAAGAPAQLLGPEFQVNTYTTGFQRGPAVAAQPGGGFVVVWESDDQDGHSWGVYGRRFDVRGDPLGGEFRVNEQTQGFQFLPEIATDGSGAFVVVWASSQESSETGIFGRLFDEDAAPRGAEFQVNVYTPETQGWPRVARNPAGEFVVAWTDQDFYFPDFTGVFARRYDATGAPTTGDFAIVPRSSDPSSIARGLLMRDDGSLIVSWTSCAYVSPWDRDCDVLAKGIGIPGPLTNTIRINTYTTSSQRGGALAARGDGGFVVVWNSYEQDGSGFGVFGQRFAADGAALGGEFRVNTHTTGSQWHEAVAADDRGNLLVAWTSDGQDGSGEGVFAQRYARTGAPVGPEFQVNAWTTDDQRYPSIAALAPGDFVVAWDSAGQDGSQKGIFARLVTSGLLIDGFESGDTSRWSSTVGE